MPAFNNKPMPPHPTKHYDFLVTWTFGVIDFSPKVKGGHFG